MKEYLLSVIGTVLVCSLITGIAPEGKTSASVKGIAKLVCVLAIIAPVLCFFKTGTLDVFADKNRQEFFSEDVIQAEEEFIQYYSEMRIRQAEKTLQEEISKEYSLTCEVALVWCMEEQIRIDKICITVLENTDEEVKKEMWQYLTENYCSEVLIE